MRSYRTVLAGLVSLACAASAQTTGTVSGVVLDSVTKSPVPGANARITGSATYTGKAGSDGRFRIDGVPEGKYRLDGYLEGYVGPSASQDLDVRFTSGSFSADVTLDPLAVLRGRVLDPHGQPIEGAQVVLYSSEMRASTGQMTDPEGRFAFQDVTPGSASLYAVPPRRAKAPVPDPKAPASDPNPPLIEMLRTYYPSAIETGPDTEIRLSPGDRNNGFDIRMIEEPVHRVRGVIRNSAGDPVPRASVLLQAALIYEPLRIRAWGSNEFPGGQSGFSTSASADAKGEFEFPSVPAGQWKLSAQSRRLVISPEQLREPTESALLEVSVGEHDVEGADIQLARPFDLLVSFEGISKEFSPTLLRELFTPVASAVGMPFRAGKMDVVSDSSVVFHNISPAEYIVSSPSSLTPYASSVTVGGQEMLGRRTDLRPGTPVHVVFSKDRATIRGSVDAPSDNYSGISVLLFPPAEAEMEPVRFLPPMSDGSFEFSGLRSATYSVTAVKDPGVARLSDAQLRDLRTKAKSVKVEGSAVETVTVTIQAVQ